MRKLLSGLVVLAGCEYIVVRGTGALPSDGGDDGSTATSKEEPSGTATGATSKEEPTSGTATGASSSSGHIDDASTGAIPRCGGIFSTEWCSQAGVEEQYTRCEQVLDSGNTCVHPEIRYGTTVGGTPSNNPGNKLDVWCSQLGFTGFVAVEYGTSKRPCPTNGGLVHGSGGFDEPLDVWHWVDSGVGFWRDAQLSTPCKPDSPELLLRVTCE